MYRNRVRTFLARACALAALIAICLSQNPAYAWQKPALELEDVDDWNLISSNVLSNNGKWLAFAAGPDGKDQVVTVKNLKDNRAWVLERASSPRFTANGEFLIFVLSPAVDSLRAMKLRGLTGDDLPDDSVGVVQLASGETRMLTKGRSYQTPEEGDPWIAFLEDSAVESGDESDEKDETSGKDDSTSPASGSKELVVINLAYADSRRIPDVSNFQFSETGNLLVYAGTEPTDSVSVIAAVKPGFDDVTKFMSAAGEFPSFAISEKGDVITFLFRADSEAKTGQVDALYVATPDAASAKLLASSGDTFMSDGWSISEHRNVSFSKSGRRIFFGVAPPPLPAIDDSTLLPEEQLDLDLWSWTDPQLQPQQLLRAKSERERTYLAAYDFETNAAVQLGSLDIPQITVSEEGDGSIALGTSTLPYSMESSWDSPGYRDVFDVEISSGKSRRILEKIQNSVQLSPGGDFLYWWDRDDLVWRTRSTKKGIEVDVTSAIPVRLDNELHDWPYKPNSYGIAGWTDSDKYMLIYDKYDIWAVDPWGENEPWRITEGAGRRDGIQYRIVNTDPDAQTISTTEPLLLSTFEFETKHGGFAEDRLKSDEEPRPFLNSEHSYRGFKKASDTEVFVYTRESFADFPDLWVTNSNFDSPRKVTDVNPQQADFAWGTAELMSWTSIDGQRLEGLLFKPEGFDPAVKYPMIVNFYEKNSQSLYSHRRPYFHRSTLNYSYYVSRGYVIFVPDIPYKVGYPGESAMNAVMPGITDLIDRGFIDREKIGAMGHSWGGYQIAYMVTQTNLFAAAVAGAPVSNMTSAYGGIRWGSGMSRMFQYERTQSRIGGSLWETPMRYWQNSPIFQADKIETPLMYQHNDHDGAVPWYQGIELFVALRRLGKPAWMLNYNDALHWVQKLHRRRDFNIRMQQFYDHYLMGEPAPEWMRQGIPGVMKNRTTGLELSDQ